MTEAAQEARGIPKSPRRSSCYDAYFERIQSRKKLPHELQENLTYAFSKVPVSSFQALQGGKGTGNIVIVHPSYNSSKTSLFRIDMNWIVQVL